MEKIFPTPEEHEAFKNDCQKYRFAWKCRDCVHLVESTGRCGLEYPNNELSAATSYDSPVGTYVFCKHFELT